MYPKKVKDDELKELAHPEYWNERYATTEKGTQDNNAAIASLDWFRTFANLHPFFEKNLPPTSSGCYILHLGCGNSTLTADLFAMGYANQISVDFSQVVIEAMSLNYSSLNTRWLVMDVRSLQLPDASVDVAIDKGTLDAMIHGSLWGPPDDVRDNVGRYTYEVARVLKPGGQWLYITYGQPHFVKPRLLKEKLWDLKMEVLSDPGNPGSFEYFSFIMTRHRV